MKGFYSLLAALCLAQTATASFPLFSIVKFENKPCDAGNNRKGTCYTSEECENKGGKKAGDTCADGFGVCCEFSEMKCGDTSRENNTYIISDTIAASSSCQYTICPCTKNVCRIKFQFDDLTLAAPTVATAGASVANTGASVGACNTDSMMISGGTGNGSPIICGDNTGQHMILDSDGNGDTCHDVNLNFGAGNAARSYSIRVTQYDCVDMTALENTAGPKGCLQYHLGDMNGAGNLDNFGYVGTPPANEAIGNTVTHLQDQNYKICMRRHAQMSRICYEVRVAGAAMPMAAMADQGSFGVSVSTDMEMAAKSAVDSNCLTDFITIPNGVAMGEANLAMAAYKFCGRFLNNQDSMASPSVKVCSRAKPFVVGVNFGAGEIIGGTMMGFDDETTLMPTGTVGFHLSYTQDAM